MASEPAQRRAITQGDGFHLIAGDVQCVRMLQRLIELAQGQAPTAVGKIGAVRAAPALGSMALAALSGTEEDARPGQLIAGRLNIEGTGIESPDEVRQLLYVGGRQRGERRHIAAAVFDDIGDITLAECA